jgi:glycosyltransferase involved in cell wall biosynthesis
MVAKKKTVVVALEHHFYECEGRIYSNLAFFYAYWERYLAVYDEVRVFARVQKVEEKGENFQLAEGPQVHFVPARAYRGFYGFLRTFPHNIFKAFCLAREFDAFILRSGNICNIIWLAIFALQKPYLREFPGNIFLGTIGVKGKAWTIVVASLALNWLAKVQARFSKANGFVSHDCKEIYGNKHVPSYVFTSFSAGEVNVCKWFNPLDVISHTSIVVLSRLEAEKNIEFLLRVLGKFPRSSVRLSVIGSGSQMLRLREVAQVENVNVTFHGLITDRNKLFETLIESDLYLLPSTTEGTPRSLLEAMTIGIPALGSRVGGIPEILPAEYLFSPQNPSELFEKISSFSAAATSERIKRSQQMKEIVEAKFLDSAQERIMFDYWRKLHAV